LCPFHFGLDDPLRVGVEVMSRFEMSANQQYEFCIGMIRTGAVDAHPKGVAGPGTGRANVGVAVMPVHAPGCQNALRKTILPGTTDVVHDLISPLFADRVSNAGGEGVQNFIPGRLLPLTAASRTLAFHGVEDALGILHLIYRRRPFGAIPSP